MEQEERDKQWGEYNRLSMQYIADGKFGLYRNVRFDMFLQLYEENKFLDAYCMLAEVFLFDINGADSPIVAPGIVNYAKKTLARLEQPKEDLNDILLSRLHAQYTPSHTFTIEEVVEMFSLYAAGENEKADAIFKSHSCILSKNVNVEDQKSENKQATNPEKPENVEVVDKKKPFWKTGKFWLILFALFILYVIIVSPTTNSAQTAARKSYISQSESILTENYDGHKIVENGDVLTVSVWDNRFTSTLLYTGIALGQTSKIAPVQDSYVSLCQNMQDAANKLKTGYTIRLQLMDADNTDSAMLIVQSGKVVKALGS